jgi:hypothetical protein
MKNSIIAGALNFFLPGAGYVYIGGKKKRFGVILLLSFILLYSTAFLTTDISTVIPQSGQSEAEQPQQMSIYDQVGTIAAFLLLFGFAYDGYNEALKKK